MVNEGKPKLLTPSALSAAPWRCGLQCKGRTLSAPCLHTGKQTSKLFASSNNKTAAFAFHIEGSRWNTVGNVFPKPVRPPSTLKSYIISFATRGTQMRTKQLINLKPIGVHYALRCLGFCDHDGLSLWTQQGTSHRTSCMKLQQKRWLSRKTWMA